MTDTTQDETRAQRALRAQAYAKAHDALLHTLLDELGQPPGETVEGRIRDMDTDRDRLSRQLAAALDEVESLKVRIRVLETPDRLREAEAAFEWAGDVLKGMFTEAEAGSPKEARKKAMSIASVAQGRERFLAFLREQADAEGLHGDDVPGEVDWTCCDAHRALQVENERLAGWGVTFGVQSTGNVLSPQWWADALGVDVEEVRAANKAARGYDAWTEAPPAREKTRGRRREPLPFKVGP